MGAGNDLEPHAAFTSRDEDAGELRLGPEFIPNKVTSVTLSEAHSLLRAKMRKADSTESVFRRAYAYTERFDRVREEENIQAIRDRIDRQLNLHPFEKAQLVNLLPENAEEAKAIIPSLRGKINEDELNHLLRDISAFTQG